MTRILRNQKITVIQFRIFFTLHSFLRNGVIQQDFISTRRRRQILSNTMLAVDQKSLLSSSSSAIKIINCSLLNDHVA